jgi:hypothetical protein
MLDHIARDRRWEGLPFATLTRAGRILWGAIEVATPRSLDELLLQHWIKLLYLFETALILAGFLVPGAQPLGIKLLLWTFGIHLAISLVRDYLAESRRAIYAVAAASTFALLALTTIGALEVWNVAASGRPARDLAGPWWIARLTGVIAAATLAMGWWMDRHSRRLQYGAGERPPAPLLALPFAQTADEFRRVAGEVWHPNRRVFRAIGEAGAWFFGGVALVFTAFGALAIVTGSPWAGSIIVAAAALAGWFEYRETQATGAILSKPLAALEPLRIAAPARAKWASCFLALGAAGYVLFSRGFGTQSASWLMAAGAIPAAASLAGLAGLAFKPVRMRLVPIAGIGMVISLALLTLILLFAPSVFGEP